MTLHSTPPARPVIDDLPSAQREAIEDLVRVSHRFSLAVATTDVGAEELRAVHEVVTSATLRLETRARRRAARSAFEDVGVAREAGEGYPIGALNPSGIIPFRVYFHEDGSAHARVIANSLHEGPNDSVHGGLGAWLMDSLLGLVLQAQGRRCVTAHLEIDYRARTPLDEPIDLFARVAESEGRKVWVEGWIEHEGRRTLESRALFVELAVR